VSRGRPSVTEEERELVLQLWSSGVPWRTIAVELGLNAVRVWRVLKEAEAFASREAGTFPPKEGP